MIGINQYNLESYVLEHTSLKYNKYKIIGVEFRSIDKYDDTRRSLMLSVTYSIENNIEIHKMIMNLSYEEFLKFLNKKRKNKISKIKNAIKITRFERSSNYIR